MSKLSKMLRARADAWAAARSDSEPFLSVLHEDLPVVGLVVPGGEAAKGPARGATRARLRFEDVELPKAEMEPLLQQVTLIVYGWHNVQPGTLSWVFPSVRMAVNAAKAMRNAVRWAIVSGQQGVESIDEARASGSVLIEHAAE